MPNISPCIWYNLDALAAAEFYVSIFENSHLEYVTHYLENDPSPSQLPAGTPLTVRFSLCGREFIGLNGGAVFKPNPAVSFFVDCESETQMDTLWNKLVEGGAVMMEVAKYPFSERFGWLADRYGVSWQISFSGKKQRITPYLMFTETVCGKAEAAIDFYCDIFRSTSGANIQHYDKNSNGLEGSVMLASFQIADQDFFAADSSYPHGFTFNEGISFFVSCQDQSEINYYWDNLTSGGQEQPCGWLKDQFGISWQIVPHNIEKLGDSAFPDKAKRVNNALMKMKKIELQVLQDAYQGD
jgi:predicted 3-demethylubiquinone-9 3-methyltransferase (glyoxalase superfamily)